MQLDRAFLNTSEALGDLPLCHARLQADSRFPWIVLIPRVSDAREIEDLLIGERTVLIEEAMAAGRAVRAVGDALGCRVTKLNVGQLGNLTPQLHVHVVGRRADDAAWPGPVWGSGAAEPYAAMELELALNAAKAALRL